MFPFNRRFRPQILCNDLFAVKTIINLSGLGAIKIEFSDRVYHPDIAWASYISPLSGDTQ